MGAAAVLLDSLILEKYFFKVKNFAIGPNTGDEELRIVLLTDLHFKDALLPQYSRLARKVNQLQPDLILITGDTLDSTGHTPPADAFFQLLDPNVKKVAIPGNNDYRAAPAIDDIRQVYERHNCDFLLNESKAYTLRGHRIMITGLDDLLEGDSNFTAAVQGVGREKHHLLLVHSPLQQEHAKRQLEKLNATRSPGEQLNIGYVFAGHTHGGQVRLPGFVPKLPPKSGGYVNGWYNDTPPYLYVSKGFGTSSLPLRFDARSEVILLRYQV